MGGDTGYAGTDNRDYCKEKKWKDLVRKELARVRATAMDGSFGTQKEHYDMRRVKARTKLTEILYIFFGIHTANVGVAGRQARAESTAGGLLKRKYAHMEKCFHRGNYASVIENGNKFGRNDRNEI